MAFGSTDQSAPAFKRGFYVSERQEGCLYSDIYGRTSRTCSCSLSVLEPVEVPHSPHKYSYRFPVGSTRSNRSRVGVARRHVGQ